MHVGDFPLFDVGMDADGLVELFAEWDYDAGIVFHPDNALRARPRRGDPERLGSVLGESARRAGCADEAREFLDAPEVPRGEDAPAARLLPPERSDRASGRRGCWSSAGHAGPDPLRATRSSPCRGASRSWSSNFPSSRSCSATWATATSSTSTQRSTSPRATRTSSSRRRACRCIRRSARRLSASARTRSCTGPTRPSTTPVSRSERWRRAAWGSSSSAGCWERTPGGFSGEATTRRFPRGPSTQSKRRRADGTVGGCDPGALDATPAARVLIVVLTAFVVAGCGDDDDSSGSSERWWNRYPGSRRRKVANFAIVTPGEGQRLRLEPAGRRGREEDRHRLGHQGRRRRQLRLRGRHADPARARDRRHEFIIAQASGYNTAAPDVAAQTEVPSLIWDNPEADAARALGQRRGPASQERRLPRRACSPRTRASRGNARDRHLGRRHELEQAWRAASCRGARR